MKTVTLGRSGPRVSRGRDVAEIDTIMQAATPVTGPSPESV
jgi:hypothetical protein